MLLIGLVTLSAVHSLWWAVVPILAGWVVWLATETILATFHLKLSLSGGPLVAQIIVLTMPAASHLAIHFRDDRRREADPRGRRAVDPARRRRRRSSGAPITGAIGYGALVTSDVVPIQQFGAILGTCTLVAALLVLAISPIAMLPPFRWRSPSGYGSRSRVAAAMNRLIAWVVPPPLARSSPACSPSCCRSRSGCSGSATSRTTSTLFKPETPRRPRLPRRRVAARRDRPGRAGRAGRARRSTRRRSAGSGGSSGRSRRSAGARARGRRTSSRWRRSSTPTAGSPLCPRVEPPDAWRQARPDRRLAAGRAAQGLLEPARRARRASWSACSSSSPPRPRRRSSAIAPTAAARGVRPGVVPDRPLVPDDQDDRGVIVDPVEHVPLVGRSAS